MVLYLSGSVSGMTAHACRWRSDMGLLRTPVEGSILPDGVIWALGSGGGVIRAEVGEWRWRSVLPAGAAPNVRSVAILPTA